MRVAPALELFEAVPHVEPRVGAARDVRDLLEQGKRSRGFALLEELHGVAELRARVGLLLGGRGGRCRKSGVPERREEGEDDHASRAPPENRLRRAS